VSRTVPQGIAAQLAGQFNLRDREAEQVEGRVRIAFDPIRIDAEPAVLVRGQQLLQGWQNHQTPSGRVGPGKAHNPKGLTVLTWPLL